MVVADSRYAAGDAAASMVQVELRAPRRRWSMFARGGAQKRTPTVRRETGTNVLSRLKVAYGDVAAAFAGAAHVFREDLYQHRGRCAHIRWRCAALLAECRARRIARSSGRRRKCPTTCFRRSPRRRASKKTACGSSRPMWAAGLVRNIAFIPEEIAVAAAARLLDRPLKWVEDRREHCMTAVQERDQYWSPRDRHRRAGSDILGIRGSLIHDQGAYALKAVNLPYNSATAVPGPYLVPNSRRRRCRMHRLDQQGAGILGTRRGLSAGRLRDGTAYGSRRPRVRLDRAEVRRRRNLIPLAKMPYSKPLKARSGAAITYDSGDYLASQAQILAAAAWD